MAELSWDEKWKALLAPLKGEDIEVRLDGLNFKETGTKLILYKTARVDRARLDDVFGPAGWETETRWSDGCFIRSISIKDENGKWITKEGVGSASGGDNSKACPFKSADSDSFKRAGSMWGIGIELYSDAVKRIVAEHITSDFFPGGDKKKLYIVGWRVDVTQGIDKLKIWDKKGNLRYEAGTKVMPKQAPPKAANDDKLKALKNEIYKASGAKNVDEFTAIIEPTIKELFGKSIDIHSLTIPQLEKLRTKF